MSSTLLVDPNSPLGIILSFVSAIGVVAFVGLALTSLWGKKFRLMLLDILVAVAFVTLGVVNLIIAVVVGLFLLVMLSYALENDGQATFHRVGSSEPPDSRGRPIDRL